LILAPATREETLRAFVRYFYGGKAATWDAVSLGQWPADSPNAKMLTNLLEASRRAHFAGVSSIVPFVPIAGDWESFWQSRSYLFRKSRRGILNRLSRLGEIEILALGGDRSEEALRLYLQVSERGWKQAEGLSAGSRPELRRFFESLTRAAGRRGWLRVWVLRIGGAAVAVEYHIESAGRVHALRADYDEAWSAHSPGACLEYHILRQLFAEGYREYSTGPGTDDYKRRWTEHERTNVSLTLCRTTPRGFGVWFLEAVLFPALRRARRRLTPAPAPAKAA
jgi:CelD/BcsL family acetyltransferase involved in cellulose biosynthesis